MSEKLKIRLANGIEIEGTIEQVAKLMKETADGIHYISSSRGQIVIKDMATPHLKNAILKTLQKEIESLRTLPTNATVVELQSGVGSNNVTLLSMIRELGTRRD